MIFLIYPTLMTMISGFLLTESRILDTDNCTIEKKDGGIKIELCAQREVIGVRGEDVILPCQFNHSYLNILEDLRLLLSKDKRTKGTPSKQNVVYNSSSNEPREDFKERIEPVGNVSSGDGTVRISHLRMEDQGWYPCRFEWTKTNGKKDGFTVREEKETNLQVDVRPKILNISSEFVNSSNTWKLFCEAEGKPEPNITWWNPQGLLLNASQMLVDKMYPNKTQNIKSRLIITNDLLEGKYKCLVQNKHGADHKFVYFKQNAQKVSWTVVLWSTLLCLVLLVLLTLGFFISKKKYKNQGTSPLQNPKEEGEVTYVTLNEIKVDSRATKSENHVHSSHDFEEENCVYAVVQK
uniref:Ig-like domain-containing protein n=1 Tax=Eptatretus burgeri TaxID=7764 RepID=A0A8C4R596_EPTBU